MAKEQDGEAGKKFPRLPFKIAQFSELLRQEELHKLCKMLSKQILYHLGLLVNSAYNMFSINLIFFSPLCPFVPVMEVCVCIQSREVRSDHTIILKINSLVVYNNAARWGCGCLTEETTVNRGFKITFLASCGHCFRFSRCLLLHHTVSSHPLMVFIMPCFTLYFLHPVTLPVVKDEYLTERFRTPGLWKRGIEKQQFLNATGLGGHLRHIKSWYSEKKETFLQEFLLLPSFAADAVNKITRALWHALPPVEL